MKERISVWEGEGGSVHETLARNITNTNNTRNLAVGTLKKSIDTRSRTLLSRKARHVWDGAVLRFGMSRETGRSETSIPSLSSSPMNSWGAPAHISFDHRLHQFSDVGVGPRPA